MKDILFLEPFYGGSHREFAEGLVQSSRHRITLATMPARFWKWRMRGAALYFSQEVEHPERYDLLVASDMLSLADLKALWGGACPPSIVYFHENQLSYPLPEGERMDYHFGFTNITTALVADTIVFNSHFQHGRFFHELPGFIRKMPEYKPTWAADVVRDKSVVLYPGCRFPVGSAPTAQEKSHEAENPAAGAPGAPGAADPGAASALADHRAAAHHTTAAHHTSADDPVGRAQQDSGSGALAPLIIWNHRWEFDKNPETFFNVLFDLQEAGVPFRVALLGENFQVVPKPFIRARDRLGPRIVRYGYVETREDYLSWLQQGTVVVSTAVQENFGISVVEAVRFGCFPLLPHRLSYPEIIPRRYHDMCLYSDTSDLRERLRAALINRPPAEVTAGLRTAMSQYAWDSIIGRYDSLFDATT